MRKLSFRQGVRRPRQVHSAVVLGGKACLPHHRELVVERLQFLLDFRVLRLRDAPFLPVDPVASVSVDAGAVDVDFNRGWDTFNWGSNWGASRTGDGSSFLRRILSRIRMSRCHDGLGIGLHGAGSSPSRCHVTLGRLHHLTLLYRMWLWRRGMIILRPTVQC
jgi:hypothetical protein